jgi:hypothetical protein
MAEAIGIVADAAAQTATVKFSDKTAHLTLLMIMAFSIM